MEEAAAAAQSLQEQAGGLSQVVSVFRLEAGHALTTAPASTSQTAATPHFASVKRAAVLRQPPAAKSAIAPPKRPQTPVPQSKQLAAAGEWEEF